MADVMGDTAGVGLIIYGGNREELQAKLRALDDRITELETALRDCLPYVGRHESEHMCNEALGVLTRANQILDAKD